MSVLHLKQDVSLASSRRNYRKEHTLRLRMGPKGLQLITIDQNLLLERNIPRAKKGSSVQIPGWIWVCLHSRPQNKPAFLDRPEVTYGKKRQKAKDKRSESERKEQSWETELSCKIHESASLLCWKRPLSLKSENKEFSLGNIKKSLHIVLPLAQNSSVFLSYSKQTEKQQANVRNSCIPLRRVQVLAQLKEVNSEYLNCRFSLCMNFHLSDVMQR